MKIVCVMPIYGRRGITLQTIDWLKKQTYPLHKIIVVGSSQEDRGTAELAKIEYVQYNNNPLTDKVQAGVERARDFDPDALLMMGSDSWITPKWCEVAKEYLDQGADLVGKTCGHTCRVDNRQYLLILTNSYRGSRVDPFGAGRLISKRALDIIDWKLFPPGFNNGLDGRSYKILTTKVEDLKIELFNDRDEALILGVKSKSWPTITPFRLVVPSNQVKVEQRIGKPTAWLERNFPGCVKDLRKIVPKFMSEKK